MRRLRAKHPGSSLAHILFFEAWSFTLHVLLTVLYRPRTFGLARVPATGPLLIVANHQSFLDPPAIGCPIIPRRHLDFIARVGLFSSPRFGSLLRRLNSIPIRQDESDMTAIRETLARLRQGRAVVVFAEGSRTPDGSVQEFKRGLALLVKRARCPVLPVAIDGAYEAWPRTRALPRPWGRIAIAYGQPIAHAELLEEGPEAALARLREQIIHMRRDLRRHLEGAAHAGPERGARGAAGA